MKSFKEYLTESKKVYEFKIKIAGDCPKDCAEKIKEALAPFKLESCSAGKSTPISEKQADFPKLENVGVTIFDVTLSYPTNNVQVREALSNKLKVEAAKIRVRNMAEEEELAINTEFDDKTNPVLGNEYEQTNNQDLVGDKRLTFLKSLKQEEKFKQINGTNDQLLASSMPKADTKIKAQETKINNVGTFSKKKVTLVPVKHKNSLNVAAKVKGK